MAKVAISRKKKIKRAKKKYITRSAALRKLQVTLRDFRRLCILKGIYPIRPTKFAYSIKKTKTYYLHDDIRFLSHEPIIWKFWEHKTFTRRLNRASNRKEYTEANVIRNNEPIYRVDHIVKERYPTFISALRDLDDALCLCFLYAQWGKSPGLPVEIVGHCRRLTIEFLHYIIESRSLRKVFISIKGYYYQAEVQGQTITWLMPHPFVIKKAKECDQRIMRTFAEFYITLLGFVNYRLYGSLKLRYPPQLKSKQTGVDEEMLAGDKFRTRCNELLSSLNRPLVRGKSDPAEDEAKIDIVEDIEDKEISDQNDDFQTTLRLQKLFGGLRFYINREVPREHLVFVIRAFGGEVSWDKTVFVGSTYEETDENITHQIVDRDSIDNKYMNRYYIQPQWVFDCVNARCLLPVERYFIGVELPPHLSPFVVESETSYVTPDAAYLKALDFGPREEDAKSDDENVEESNDEEDEKEEEKEKEKREAIKKKRAADAAANEIDKEERRKLSKAKMRVESGKLPKEINEKKEKKRAAEEENNLAVMMIPRKRKKIYNKLMTQRRVENDKNNKLKSKRERWEKAKRQKNSRNVK